MKFRSPLSRHPRPQSSAFLDVLFILLATFILVTTLADDRERPPDDAMIEVQLPVLEYHEGRSPQANRLDEMILSLKASGEVHFDGTPVGSGSAALKRVEAIVQQRLGSQAEPYVRMFADEKADVGELLPLISLLKELGIAKIDLMGEDGKAASGRGVR